MAKSKKPNPRELYWARKRKEEAERSALLPPGLINHGNTCFMNSVLQGLIGTVLLEELVLFRLPSRRYVPPSASHRSPLIVNGRGPEESQHEWVQGMPIGDVFLHTLERAWQMRDERGRSSMSPKELLGRLGQKYDQYLDFRQQDAHEFFLHLLDGIRMEEFDIIKHRQPRLSSKSSKRRPRGPGITAHSLPEVIPEEERLVSFVDVLWGGRFTSVLICGTCKHVSHTYEDFDDLSLSISHDESKERKRDRLRAFASKFMSPSNRFRDQGQPRPQSASQPPSPSLPITPLEPMEEVVEPPRRRSLETSSLREASPEPAAERRKVEILAGIKNGEEELKEPTTQSSGLRPQKVNDVGLGRLGRRISVGMSLGARRERILGRADKEQKPTRAEVIKLSKSSEPDEDGTSFSPAGSKPISRQPSPGPIKKQLGPPKRPNLSPDELLEAAYLRRLLEDVTPSLSNPLAALRLTNSTGSNTSSAWSKISSAQSVEDCLRMFTAVEALDGDNMFGCRNCWKIANGQSPKKTVSQSEEDSDDSSVADEQRGQDRQSSSSRVLESVQSFSMPNLPPMLGEDHSTSSLSTSTRSSPFPTPSSEINHSTLGLDAGQSVSTSATSLATKPRTNGSGSHKNIVGLSLQEEKSSSHLPTYEPGPRDPPIPIIATISPPPESSTSGLFQNHIPNGSSPKSSENMGLPQDSLRLPEVRFHHRTDSNREGESSVSSDESEQDDASGVSDGDASLVSVPRSIDTRRPRRSSLPRSKQVIYRRALKRYLIARPPPILVIHLKRFQQVSKSPVTLFGSLKKLDDYVSFPEYLDMRPFLAPKREDYGLGRGELKGKIIEKGRREEDQACVYRLYSVVVHIGNMLGGHYIAYTALPSAHEGALSSSKDDTASNESKPSTQSIPGKGPNTEANKRERQWCYISDTIVRLASLDEVLKAKAYLCMYERIQ